MRRKYPPLTPDEVIRILKARGFTNPDKPEPKRRQPPLPKSLHKKQEFRGLGTITIPQAAMNTTWVRSAAQPGELLLTVTTANSATS